MKRSSLLLLAVLGAASAAVAGVQIRLGEHAFDWTTVEQERAHYSWSAEVVNSSTDAFDVVVSIDLLDDDDAVVRCDREPQCGTDSVRISVPAGQTRTARHENSLPFDRAADVVSFRFRLDPQPPKR